MDITSVKPTFFGMGQNLEIRREINVLRQQWCPGTESNCRHVDFQSTKKAQKTLISLGFAIFMPLLCLQIPPAGVLLYEYFPRSVSLLGFW
jgi:hypothetical protein